MMRTRAKRQLSFTVTDMPGEDDNAKSKVKAILCDPIFTISDEMWLSETTNLRVRDRIQHRLHARVRAVSSEPFMVLERNTPKFFYTSLSVRLTIIVFLTILSFVVHFYKLSEPASVAFDEVHFGTFTNHYLRRRFFFDVHPPLAKLMLAATAWLSGYDGKFPFKKIHDSYLLMNVPYVLLRSVSALFGTLLIPVSYLTVSHMGYSIVGATLTAFAVLFESLFVTQSRLILLDAPLLFFIACAVYGSIRFSNVSRHPLTRRWWWWLAFTGMHLGLAVSVKWVGLFVIALVGLKTIQELWNLLGDKTLRLRTWVTHFFSRVLCLIILPVTIYISVFYIHLVILNTNGPGSAFMGQEFRDGLYTMTENDDRGISSGSRITLALLKHVDVNIETNDGLANDPKQNGYLSVFLHSNSELYPMKGSSLEQQVTGFTAKHHNNWFVIEHADHDTHPKLVGADFIHTNDVVFLRHGVSNRGLFVHGFLGPISTTALEVSAFDGEGHPWRVTLVKQASHRLQIRTKLRFHHHLHNCVLAVSGEILPDWGMMQEEVVCVPDGQWNDKNSAWLIDDVEQLGYSQASYAPPLGDRSSFFTRMKDIIQLQIVAWDANKRLNGKHVYESRPLNWPFLKRGISYWQNRPSSSQIYLLGNPAIFTACVLSLPVYLLLALTYTLRKQRGYCDMDGERERRFWLIGYLWLGYCLHYVPFFFMTRQLFLHHYLPAHYFAILSVGCLYDHCASSLCKVRPRVVGAIIISLLFIWWFWKIAPLAYSLPMTKKARAETRLRKTWDFF